MLAKPGLSRLRFDGKLQGFNNILKMFFDAPERVKASGKKVVAKWALSPTDPIYAGGALAYDPYTHETLTHVVFQEDMRVPNYAIEAGLGPNFCPWSLAMAGAVISGMTVVPIDLYSTACGCCEDSVQSWYLMARETGKPFHLVDLPRFDPESEEWAIDYLVKELSAQFDWLKEYTGCEVTDEGLRKELRQENKVRQALIEITELLRAERVPIPALEYFIVQLVIADGLQDPASLYREYHTLYEELEQRVKIGIAAPGIRENPLRVYYSGMPTQEFQIWNIIEDTGGMLVGCDTYLTLFREQVPENGSPLGALAKWIWKMPHQLPTSRRIEAVVPFMKRQGAEVVILNNNIGCRNLSEADTLAKDLIKDELGVPVISIETRFPLENIEAVESRIKTFIEINR